MADIEAQGLQKPPLPPRRPPRPTRRPHSTPANAPPRNRSHRFSQAPPVEAYVPPFRKRRLALAQTSEPQPGSRPAQFAAWSDLTKAVHGAINRVSPDTVPEAAKALLRVNVMRARGLLCKTILRAQLGSPGLAPVLASLVAVINSRVPPFAALLVARLVAQLKEAYRTQDRSLCFATARFMACLYNQHVVSELLVLEFLTACLMDPSDGSIELAAKTLAECAPFLADRSPKACEIVFQRLREVLHDGDLGRHAQVLIENLMARRRRKFDGENSLDPRLDLLEEDDMITHFISMEEEEEQNLDEECNGFQFDPEYLKNEQEYKEISKEILGRECVIAAIASAGESVSNVQTLDRDANIEKSGEGGGQNAGQSGIGTDGNVEQPKDMTFSDLVDFRRAVYLTIHSGLTYEEWAHKLLKLIRKNRGREKDLCEMIIECCSQEKTFNRAYGLLGQRFCLLDRIYVAHFEAIFAVHYATIHRFEPKKIRNIACFYASLLASDALPWNVLQVVRLVEEETTSSSRIFLKHLFLEMYKSMGTAKFKEHFKVPALERVLEGVFPSDSVENASFSINFFAKIGLGFLTEELREKLKSLPKDLRPDADEGESSSLSSSSSSLSSSSLSPSTGGEDDRAEVQSIGSKRANEEDANSDGNRPPKRLKSLEQTGEIDSSGAVRQIEHHTEPEVLSAAHRESAVGKQTVVVEKKAEIYSDSRDIDRPLSPRAQKFLDGGNQSGMHEEKGGYASSEGDSERRYGNYEQNHQTVSKSKRRDRRSRRDYSDDSQKRSEDNHKRYGKEDIPRRSHGSRRESVGASQRSYSPSRRYSSDDSRSPRSRRLQRSSRRKKHTSNHSYRYTDYESDFTDESRGYRRTGVGRRQSKEHEHLNYPRSQEAYQDRSRSRRYSDDEYCSGEERYYREKRRRWSPSGRSISPEWRKHRSDRHTSDAKKPRSGPNETQVKATSESSYSSREANYNRAKRHSRHWRESARALSSEPLIRKHRRSRHRSRDFGRD